MHKLGRSENLSELVLEKIQRSILDREFMPGALLPSEKDMAEMYGVGKSSVREAVKMLAALGVVECTQGKGTYLRDSLGPQVMRPLLCELMLQQSTAQELYDFRLMFDIAWFSIAVAKATEEDRRRARLRFVEYKSLYESGLPASQADMAFHMSMIEATRNQFIIKVGALVMNLCAPYLEGSNCIRNPEAMASHEKLLEIFCTGNAAGLEEAVKGSMLVFKKVLEQKYGTGDEAGLRATGS